MDTAAPTPSLCANGQPVPTRYVPLWWHTAGRQYTASGYGRRIPTPHMVQIPGSPRWRRVYCCVFSNAGTCYVESSERKPDGRRAWIVITN